MASSLLERCMYTSIFRSVQGCYLENTYLGVGLQKYYSPTSRKGLPGLGKSPVPTTSKRMRQGLESQWCEGWGPPDSPMISTEDPTRLLRKSI